MHSSRLCAWPTARLLRRLSNPSHAFGKADRQADAEKQIAKLHDLSKSKYVPPYCSALVWMGLGNTEQALEWLERAYEERESRLLFKHDGIYDPLRSDPRFQDLLRRMGL